MHSVGLRGPEGTCRRDAITLVLSLTYDLNFPRVRLASAVGLCHRLPLRLYHVLPNQLMPSNCVETYFKLPAANSFRGCSSQTN